MSHKVPANPSSLRPFQPRNNKSCKMLVNSLILFSKRHLLLGSCCSAKVIKDLIWTFQPAVVVHFCSAADQLCVQVQDRFVVRSDLQLHSKKGRCLWVGHPRNSGARQRRIEGGRDLGHCNQFQCS